MPNKFRPETVYDTVTNSREEFKIESSDYVKLTLAKLQVMQFVITLIIGWLGATNEMPPFAAIGLLICLLELSRSLRHLQHAANSELELVGLQACHQIIKMDNALRGIRCSNSSP